MSTEELVRACADSTDDRPAWEEFMRRYHRLIVGVVFRTVHQWGEDSREVVDDLVQETYLKLCAEQCRLLRQFDFAHPGSIFGYLKAIAANVVHDRFRSLHTEKRRGDHQAEDLDSVETATASNFFGSQDAMEKAVLLEEVHGLLQAHVSGPDGERDRTIFWLYYRQGLTAQAIAALPSIELSAKGVESTILRLTRLLRTQMVEGRFMSAKG